MPGRTIYDVMVEPDGEFWLVYVPAVEDLAPKLVSGDKTANSPE